jgi:hypothetical protein
MSAFKLGMLLLRTLAKPVTSRLKIQAKDNEAFKNLCVGIAQRMHKAEVKLRVGGLKETVSQREMRPLNEAKWVII